VVCVIGRTRREKIKEHIGEIGKKRVCFLEVGKKRDGGFDTRGKKSSIAFGASGVGESHWIYEGEVRRKEKKKKKTTHKTS